MSSTIQYSSGSQLACHCRSRFPSGCFPVAPQFAPAAARWSLWHCLTKDRHTAAAARFVTAHRQSAASQSLRPQGNFLPSSALMRPATTTPRFCRQKNQSRCFSLSRRGASRSHGLSSCHQSPRRCCQLSPVSSISPYSGSANGQLIWTPRMKRTESVVDGRNQPTCGDILGRARQ